MATTTSKSSPPKRRKRKNKPSFHLEEHFMYGKEVKLFRTAASGKVWQMRVWITEEQKYFRKSTRTTDLELARVKARDLYLDIHAKIRSGEPVFPKTAQELVDEFLAQKEKEVGVNKTRGRYVTIRSQMKHYLAFVGSDTKLTDIPRTKWDDYYIFRRKNHPTVESVTLNNEKSTIRSMYRFAIRRGYVPHNYLPEFPTLKRDVKRRDALERDEWRTIYSHMKKWGKDKDDKTKEQLEFIRNFTLVLANTGLRFGECRKLQWRDIKLRTINREDGKSQKIANIHLEASKTKNNKERWVIGRNGYVFERIKNISKWTKPSDFIFVDNDTGKPVVRDVYYKHWNQMLKDTGLNETGKSITFYNLRHTYATWRLYAGVEPFSLAKNLGCTMQYLQDHYGHVEVQKMARNLIKDMKMDESGEIILD